jgi:hypothetical protein
MSPSVQQLLSRVQLESQGKMMVARVGQAPSPVQSGGVR